MRFPLQKIMVTEYDPLTNQFKQTMKNIRTIHNNINTKIKSAIIAYYTMPNNFRSNSKINKSNTMEYYEKVDYKLKQNINKGACFNIKSYKSELNNFMTNL